VGSPFTGHKGAVSAVDISNDGHRIVSGSDDATLRLWGADTGQLVGAPMTGGTGHRLQRGLPGPADSTGQSKRLLTTIFPATDLQIH
jgi:WD40 repeat protein